MKGGWAGRHPVLPLLTKKAFVTDQLTEARECRSTLPAGSAVWGCGMSNRKQNLTQSKLTPKISMPPPPDRQGLGYQPAERQAVTLYHSENS